MPVKDTEQSVWFESPRQSLAGMCFMGARYTNKDFISKAKSVHGERYLYDLVEYDGIYGKVGIICPVHGVFYQMAYSHLRGHGCPNCAPIVVGENIRRRNAKAFEEKARSKHGDKYDYSLVNYISAFTPVDIICPHHGIFKQMPAEHLRGRGCTRCGYIKNGRKTALTQEIFEQRANSIHNNKYDYSETIYTLIMSNVTIICPIHGRFVQSANGHLQGQGCPHCFNSRGERFIRNILINRHIEFLMHSGFPTCRYKRGLKFDFFLPHYNILIEFQGKQHFISQKHFGGDNAFLELKIKDAYKKQWALDNGYLFKEYTYKQSWDYIEGDLLKTIKQCQLLAS